MGPFGSDVHGSESVWFIEETLSGSIIRTRTGPVPHREDCVSLPVWNTTGWNAGNVFLPGW